MPVIRLERRQVTGSKVKERCKEGQQGGQGPVRESLTGKASLATERPVGAST